MEKENPFLHWILIAMAAFNSALNVLLSPFLSAGTPSDREGKMLKALQVDVLSE